MKTQRFILSASLLMLMSAGLPAPPAQASTPHHRKGVSSSRTLRNTASKSHLSKLKARVKSHPKDRIARLELARAYEASGNRAMALDTYRQLIATAGPKERNNTGERDLLLRNTGRLYMALGQPGKAIPLLQSALAIHPWDTHLRDSLRAAFASNGQSQQAAKLLREGRDYYIAQRIIPQKL